MTWQIGSRVVRATNPHSVRESGTVLASNRSMTVVQWDKGDCTSIPTGWLA